MKSTLLNMVLVLLGITLVSATTLGLVYGVTKEPIDLSKGAKTTNALSQVMPPFDNDPSTDTVTCIIDDMPIKVYKGMSGETVSGYAVETMTKNGFSGEFRLMVGMKPDGEIFNIEVLQHNETPGLGSKMADPDNVLLLSFQGKNPKNLKMSVRKDGGDIDVITASTISSRAYVDAVERAYKAFESVALGSEPEEDEDVDYLAAVLNASPTSIVEENITIDANEAKVIKAMGDSTVLGYVVDVASKVGKGVIRLMVGFTPDGYISNVAVIEHNEDPRYGALIENPDNATLSSLKGTKARDIKWSFKPDGGTADTISGATRTSRSYLQSIQNAFMFYQAYIDSKTEK